MDIPPAPIAKPTRRPLRIAGSAALGLVLALGAGMIGALVRGTTLRGRTEALSEAYKGQLIPEPENGQLEHEDRAVAPTTRSGGTRRRGR